jgi:SAM-dependent methyltransferase
MAGYFHPAKIVTGAFGGRLLGPIKRAVVKRLYTHLARHYPTAEWTAMNYGYAPLGGEAPLIEVPDVPERFNLNLYARVAASGRRGAALGGVDLLEIGSGRGGGLAFVAQACAPASATGLDIAPTATALASERYAYIDNLRFVTGDAEALLLGDARFDIVINIESIHCYARPDRFFAEVARVLRPSGELLFAGFVARGRAYDDLVAALRASPLRLDRLDDITANVTASLAGDEARKKAFLDDNVKGALKSFATGAYAMKGSPMRTALDSGTTAYIAAVLSKV